MILKKIIINFVILTIIFYLFQQERDEVQTDLQTAVAPGSNTLLEAQAGIRTLMEEVKRLDNKSLITELVLSI